jgi:hypothetical protein
MVRPKGCRKQHLFAIESIATQAGLVRKSINFYPKSATEALSAGLEFARLRECCTSGLNPPSYKSEGSGDVEHN